MSDPHRDPYNIGQDNRLAGDRFVCGDCGYLWPTLTLGTPFEFDRCRECGGQMTAVWNVYPGGGTDAVVTDTPDLRTLAADAIVRVHHGGELLDLDDDDQAAYVDLADAVLAAVLPAHRRQVLAEAADSLRPVKRRLFAALIAVVDRLDQPYPDAPEHTPWTRFVKPAMHNLDAAIRRLASAAAETAPSPRHDDETAPAVGREAAQAQGPAEGDTALGADQIPERVYLDAAKAHVKALFSHRPQLSDATLTQSKRPGFRAAVAAAYRAGQAVVPDGPRTWQLPDGAEVEEQWMVRSHWPNGQITEAYYSNRPIAELETDLRQRYSGCKVELLQRRTVITTPWEAVTDATPADGQDGGGP